MSVKTSEININIGGKDVGAGKVLDATAAKVDRLGKSAKDFLREKRASGEMAFDKLLSGNGERALDYLFNLGTKVALTTFVMERFGAAADSMVEHMKKVREGSEDTATAIIKMAEAVPVFGAAVTAGMSVGKFYHALTGGRDLEDELKAAEVIRDRQIAQAERLRKLQEEANHGDEVGLKAAKRKQELELESITKGRSKRLADAADEAEREFRLAHKVPARDERFNLGDLSGTIDVASLTKFDEEIAKVRAVAQANVAANIDEEISAQKKIHGREINRAERETVLTSMKMARERADAIIESEFRIRDVRMKMQEESLKDVGFDFAARRVAAYAEYQQAIHAIRAKAASEYSPDKGMAENTAIAQRALREEFSARAKFNADVDRVTTDKASAKRGEEAKEVAERYQSAVGAAEVQRRLGAEQLNLAREAAEHGDKGAWRTEKLLEITTQYADQRERIVQLAKDENATVMQRLEAAAMITKTNKEEQRAKDRLLNPYVPGTTAATAESSQLSGLAQASRENGQTSDLQATAKNTGTSAEYLAAIKAAAGVIANALTGLKLPSFAK